MDELGINEPLSNYKWKPVANIDYNYLKIVAIVLVLVMMCAFCKNYRIDHTRRYRGKVVSFV
jgi:hypothetical protein